jgi:hypothetical protein
LRKGISPSIGKKLKEFTKVQDVGLPIKGLIIGETVIADRIRVPIIIRDHYRTIV